MLDTKKLENEQGMRKMQQIKKLVSKYGYKNLIEALKTNMVV